MNPDPVILITTSAAWLAGLIGGLRLTAKPSKPTPSATPPFAIIIPARNEAHNLPRLLDSIRQQDLQPTEWIVVDDHSEDDTRRIAEQYGARVLSSQPLPEGWRGKTWACHQGVAATNSPWLIFLDADTWIKPGGLQQLMQHPQPGATSWLPDHLTRHPYEWLSQFFNLTMALGTLPHGLLGQVLRMDRHSYQIVGGHESVRSEILENHHLANRLKSLGIPAESHSGKHLVGIRMYPGGIHELIEGWTKGFARGATTTPKAVVCLIALWMTGLFLPLFIWPITPLAPWLYLAMAIQLAFLSRKVGNFPPILSLLYPIPLFFYLAILIRSSQRSGKTVTWKGRTLHAP